MISAEEAGRRLNAAGRVGMSTRDLLAHWAKLFPVSKAEPGTGEAHKKNGSSVLGAPVLPNQEQPTQ